MTQLHFAPAPIDLLAVAGEAAATLRSGPFTPALFISLCIAAGLATWLALPSKKEIAIRRIGLVVLGAVGLIVAAMLVRWTVDQGGMGVYFWLFSAVALFASVRVITHTKPVYSALYFVLTVFATGGLFVLLWAEFIAAALVLIYAGAILITYVFVIMLASEASTGGVGSAAERISDHDAVSRDPFLAALTGFAVTGLLIFVLFDKAAGQNHATSIVNGAVNVNGVLYADGYVDWVPVGWGSWQNDDIYTSRGGVGRGAIPSSSWQDRATSKPKAEVAAVDSIGSAQALGQELLENQALNIQLAAVILTVAMVGAITLARRRVLVAGPNTPAPDTLTTPGTPADDNPKTIAVYGTDNPRHKAYPEN